MGDLNGDGAPDLAVAATEDSSVNVLLNHGDGTFAAAVFYSPGTVGTAGVAMGDVNGDGVLDLVVANRGYNSPFSDYRSGTVGVLVNNGAGTFAKVVLYRSGARPSAIVAVDLNGDGKLDLAVANRDRSVSVLLESCLP